MDMFEPRTEPPAPRPAWEPQGRALLAHLNGDKRAAIVIHATGAERELVAAAHFFRAEDALEPWEHKALQACRGRVLDVGAGAGCHALALQALAAGSTPSAPAPVESVVALDLCPLAVRVMRSRGVIDARSGVLAEVDDGPYDTLLFLMHGIGVVGDLDGLAWTLADAHRLLAPGGRIVLDSRDPGSDEHGSIELRLEYDGCVGAPFWWLFVSEPALRKLAARVGWQTDLLCREPDGRYVARLTRA